MNLRPIRYIVLLVILLHFKANIAFAGWEVQQSGFDSLCILQYYSSTEVGHKLLAGALEELKKEGKLNQLTSLFVVELLDDSVFENEILSLLQKNNPTELEAALRSAENMHNPKVIALRDAVNNAVFGTATVEKINKELNSYGLNVLSASHEKLTIYEKDGVKHFFAFLWLSIK
ncbi:MAG: hypothetical protein AB1724_00035 [Thermodesulfobacteriota bacterium]